METGHRYNSSVLSNSGQGLSNSAINNKQLVEPLTVNTVIFRNPEMSGADDDSNKILSGIGEGEVASGGGGVSQRWGHTTTSGSRIEIDDKTGEESITIVHGSSQSGIKIEPDGSVFVSSGSKRGGGIGAPMGDYFIKAGGDLVINGSAAIQINTDGDLSLIVGGTLTIKAGAIKVITDTLDETIDGSAVRNVTNDQSVTIGGVERKTIAGDMREQITGKKIMDVGSDYTSRVGGKRAEYTTGDEEMVTNGKLLVSSKGDQEIVSGAKQTVSAVGNQSLITDANVSVSAKGTSRYVSEGSGAIGSKADFSVASDGAVKIGGASVHSDPPIDRADFSGQTAVAAMLGSVTAPPAVSAGSAGSAGSATKAPDSKPAAVTEANDIVDELTTKRKYPEYPNNAKLEMGSSTGLGMISGDETNGAEQVYNEVSSQNYGNNDPAQASETVATYPEDSAIRSNDIAAYDPNMPIPSRASVGTKISKYFTLGHFTKQVQGNHPIPASKWDSVVKNFILLANNVLDPIKEKFPNIIITSAYRANSPNHISGRAVDIVIESRDMMVHAEIAKFARDNLPVDQVLLEKNTSGRSHVHLRVSPTGAKVKPRVLTCGDPRCLNKTAGIDLAYLRRFRTK